MDAIGQRPSTALMVRLTGRERERDEALARVAALEAKRKGREDIQLTPETLDVLIEELRRGLKADHATVRDTLQRIAAKAEIKRTGERSNCAFPCHVRSFLFISPGECEQQDR